MQIILRSKVKIFAIIFAFIAIFVSAWLLVSYWFLTTDEFGTRRISWNWTYGLSYGEIEVLSCEGFNTDFGSVNHRITEIRVDRLQNGERLVVNEETFILRGGGNWHYLQIRANDDLVRHRFPENDARPRPLLPADFMRFLTEEFDLQIGVNRVSLVAILPGHIPGSYPGIDVDNCAEKTIYLIREE